MNADVVLLRHVVEAWSVAVHPLVVSRVPSDKGDAYAPAPRNRRMSRHPLRRFARHRRRRRLRVLDLNRIASWHRHRHLVRIPRRQHQRMRRGCDADSLIGQRNGRDHPSIGRGRPLTARGHVLIGQQRGSMGRRGRRCSRPGHDSIDRRICWATNSRAHHRRRPSVCVVDGGACVTVDRRNVRRRAPRNQSLRGQDGHRGGHLRGSPARSHVLSDLCGSGGRRQRLRH